MLKNNKNYGGPNNNLKLKPSLYLSNFHKSSLIWLILSTILHILSSQETVDKSKLHETHCLTDTLLRFEDKPPQNRKAFLNYCFEHVSNTGGSLYHTTGIQNYMSEVKNTTRIENDCYQTTRNVKCSQCDGYLGIGHKIGYCSSYCSLWYEKCKDTLFYKVEQYQIKSDNNEIIELEFGRKDQDISECEKLIDVIPPNDSDKFCEIMGLEITDESVGYKGVPAGFIDPLKRKKNPNANKVHKVPIELSMLWSELTIKAVGKYLVGLTIIISGFSCIWMFVNRENAKISHNEEIDRKRKELIEKRNKKKR